MWQRTLDGTDRNEAPLHITKTRTDNSYDSRTWMYERSQYQQLLDLSRMADIRAGSAFLIGERPDLTIFISNTSGKQNAPQEDGAILKLHKSVLSEYEYFKQRFSAQPNVSNGTFQLTYASSLH